MTFWHLLSIFSFFLSALFPTRSCINGGEFLGLMHATVLNLGSVRVKQMNLRVMVP